MVSELVGESEALASHVLAAVEEHEGLFVAPHVRTGHTISKPEDHHRELRRLFDDDQQVMDRTLEAESELCPRGARCRYRLPDVRRRHQTLSVRAWP